MIPFVDLKAQYASIKDEVAVAIQGVLESCQFTLGSEVAALEKEFAEYCGTRHSGMIGWVEVMEPTDFQAWLGGGRASDSPAAAGEKLFQDLVCISCHRDDAQARGPQLKGLFGHTVRLQGGATAVADEAYIRESIVNPQAKIVDGFLPIMPTFQGLVSEEQLLQLIAYVRSLGEATPPAPGGAAAPPGPGKD